MQIGGTNSCTFKILLRCLSRHQILFIQTGLIKRWIYKTTKNCYSALICNTFKTTLSFGNAKVDNLQIYYFKKFWVLKIARGEIYLVWSLLITSHCVFLRRRQKYWGFLAFLLTDPCQVLAHFGKSNVWNFAHSSVCSQKLSQELTVQILLIYGIKLKGYYWWILMESFFEKNYGCVKINPKKKLFWCQANIDNEK